MNLIPVAPDDDDPVAVESVDDNATIGVLDVAVVALESAAFLSLLILRERNC